MPAHANAGKMHCRLHKLRFTGDDQPSFDDVLDTLPGGRCRACIYPGRPGSAHLGLADEDMELNAEDPRACFKGFYIGVCKDHAELVFDRAVWHISLRNLPRSNTRLRRLLTRARRSRCPSALGLRFRIKSKSAGSFSQYRSTLIGSVYPLSARG